MDEDLVREIYKRAHKLTDAIMAKFGELHLRATLQPPAQDNGIFTSEKIDPRSEIWNLVVCFLGDEEEEKNGS